MYSLCTHLSQALQDGVLPACWVGFPVPAGSCNFHMLRSLQVSASMLLNSNDRWPGGYSLMW